MASKIVLLCGYYGFGNGGDEALLATLIQMLPAGTTPVVMSANPSLTAQQHRVQTCDRNNIVQVISWMFKAKGFVWGGGSLIQDSSSWASPLFYVAWMTLAQGLRLKTVAWAQGIGPLHRGWIETIARKSFGACSARSIRDVGSADLLQKWSQEYQLAPDPVWALTGTPSPSSVPVSAQRVAIVLRSHPLLTAERLETLTQALELFENNTGAQIVLLPFQRSLDYAIAQQIQPRLSSRTELILEEDPRMLKGIFQSIDFTIAMRLHGLIMAAAEGNRCFALSYDPKVTRLMEDLHMKGYDLSKLPTHAATIAQDWQNCLEAANPIERQTIGDRIEQSQMHQKLLAQVFG